MRTISVVDPGGAPDRTCRDIRKYCSEIRAEMAAFTDAGFQFCKWYDRSAAILFQDLEFSFHIEFFNLVGFEVVVGFEFSLNERIIIKRLCAEKTDHEADSFPIRF